MSAIFLRQLWKQKPRQLGPVHAVRAAVAENCQRIGIDYSKSVGLYPFWNPGISIDFSKYSNSAEGGIYSRKAMDTTSNSEVINPNEVVPYQNVYNRATSFTMCFNCYISSAYSYYYPFDISGDGSPFYMRVIGANYDGSFYAYGSSNTFESQNLYGEHDICLSFDKTVGSAFLYKNAKILPWMSEDISGSSLQGKTASNVFLFSRSDKLYGVPKIKYFYAFDDALSQGQIAEMANNPYQLFQPIQRVYYSIPDSAGPVNYTLPAALGSFDLSGEIAGLFFNRKLESTAGQYDLTGSGIGLLKNSVVSAENGTVSISGSPASILLDRVLASMPGGYSLTGSDATLFYASESALSADSGSFVITGSDANLTKNSVLFAANGEHTIGGSAAALLIDRILSATSGDYDVTGSTVNLLCNRKIDAGSGEYSLAGADAGLSYVSGLEIIADAGSFTITGTDAGLKYNRRIPVEPGSITMSGKAAALLFNRVLESEMGTFSITGPDADFLRNFVLSADSGEFELTGQSVTLFYSGIVLPSGEISVTFTVKKPAMLFSAKKPTITFN